MTMAADDKLSQWRRGQTHEPRMTMAADDKLSQWRRGETHDPFETLFMFRTV